MDQQVATRPRQNDIHHSWQSLPTELKAMVLRHLLLLPDSVMLPKHTRHSARYLLKLLLTNKEMASLAFDVYYGENTFLITRSFNRKNHERYRKMGTIRPYNWAYPNPAVGQLVRSLEVIIRTDSDAGFEMARTSERSIQWAHLFIDDSKPELSNCSAWQRKFPKINHLKLVVTFKKTLDTRSCCLGENLQRTIDDMSTTRIELKTRELEIEVRGLPCLQNSKCGGRCEEHIKKTIRGMVRIREFS